jgi:pyridoxine kinase
MLHTRYKVPHVVISSIPITKERATWLPDRLARIKRPDTEGIAWAEEPLLCVASSADRDSTSTSKVYAMGIPQIKGYFSGVGDLFSALVLGHYSPSEVTQDATTTTPLSHAVCNAVRTTHAILRKTAIASAQVPGANHTDDELDKADPNRRARRMKARELRIVGSIDIILSAGKSELGAVDGFDEMQLWEEFWA